MLEENYLDNILTVYSILIIILFIIMYKKHTYPKLWIAVAISNGFASLFFGFRHFNPEFRIIGNIFTFFTATLLGISIILEYYREIYSTQENKLKTEIIFIILGLLSFISLSIILFQVNLINTIQIFLLSFLIFLVFFMIKLYRKKKSITRAFMTMTVLYAIFTVFFSILYNIGIEISWEVAYIMKIMFYSNLLCTGFSASMEDRLKRTEKKFLDSYYRAELYKDLFVHDINNILQIILSANQLLKIPELNNDKEKHEDYLRMIEEQVNRGSILVRNLNKLSEIEEKKILLKKIEILALLKTTIEHIKDNYKEKKINIQLITPFEDIYINANELIIDVFENILINSIKHNLNTEIKIVIKLSKTQILDQKYNKFEILDNAKGIDDSRKELIFIRASEQVRNLEGLGLGLSLVKKIISIFNGKIWVENRVKSDYKQGSKFIILIPDAYL